MSQRDFATLTHPTTQKQPRDNGSEEPTVESETWPDEATVLALMRAGFSYDDALHMPPRDYRRYSHILTSWSIPASERNGGVRVATQADIDAMFGSDQ